MCFSESMDIQAMLHTIGEQISATANVRTVYGDPVVTADRTVVPIAKVSYAFGAGGATGRDPQAKEGHGGGGGGARVSAHPCGALEISREGTRFVAFPNYAAAGAAFAAGFALGALVLALTKTKRIEIVKALPPRGAEQLQKL